MNNISVEHTHCQEGFVINIKMFAKIYWCRRYIYNIIMPLELMNHKKVPANLSNTFYNRNKNGFTSKSYTMLLISYKL